MRELKTLPSDRKLAVKELKANMQRWIHAANTKMEHLEKLFTEFKIYGVTRGTLVDNVILEISYAGFVAMVEVEHDKINRKLKLGTNVDIMLPDNNGYLEYCMSNYRW